MTMRTLARAQGSFNVVNGLWPLLHMRSFEAVLGPKVDHWLVNTVAGLLVTNGIVQLRAATSGDLRTARLIGVGTAGTLAAIDVRYAVTGRISKVYLVDAVLEAFWLAGWFAPRGRPGTGASGTYSPG